MVAKKLPDWLPAGWTEQVKVKNNRKVKCYVDPLTGRTFFSKPEVSQYLRTVKHSSSASKRKKMDTLSPITCQLTGGKTMLKPEGSQIRTRSSPKQIDIGFSNEAAENPKMDELTDGKPSLKEERSQNVKTLKQTSCKSKRKLTGNTQLANKVLIERVMPDGLPPGWKKEIKIQTKANGTRKDEDKMGELSEATNSCKLRGSQNVKTPKSRTSKPKEMGSTEQPAGKVVIESVSLDGLPPGWLQEVCYTDPVSGYVFFSREDALCYVETGDFDKCIIKPKKREELGFFNKDISPNMNKLTGVKNSLKQGESHVTGVKNSLKQGESQNVITRKVTRCISEQKKTGFNKQSADKSNKVEIAEDQTSPKQEGSQDVKTPKCTSRLSKRKAMIERVTPDGLPQGWIKEIKIQKKANGTRKYAYYTDPVSGYVFWSQKDALRYVETGDISQCTMKPKKRDEFGFLNEAASLILPSVAVTEKLEHHTLKGRLFAGTRHIVTRSLETTDAGGARTREHIREGKLSHGNAIIESAATAESYDPSSSATPITKCSKRKRSEIVGTESRSVSKTKGKRNSSKEKNKSSRKTQSKKKTALGVPCRLVGPKSEITKSRETECEPSVGPHDDMARRGHQQFQIVSETEIADYSSKGPEVHSGSSARLTGHKSDIDESRETGHEPSVGPHDDVAHGGPETEIADYSVKAPEVPPNIAPCESSAGLVGPESCETEHGPSVGSHDDPNHFRTVSETDIADYTFRVPEVQPNAVPCGSSARLVGPKSEVVKSPENEHEPSVGPHRDVAHSSPETEIADYSVKDPEVPPNIVPCAGLVGPHDDVAHSDPHQFRTVSETDIADYSFKAPEVQPPNIAPCGSSAGLVGPHKDVAHSDPHQFRTVSETDIADYSFKAPEVQPNAGPTCDTVESPENEHESSVGPHDDVADSDLQQFRTVSETPIAYYSFKHPEVSPNAELSNACKKNPLEDDQPAAMEETVKTDVENPDQMNPFGDSWSDPCLEFAFKTLSGEMPIDDNLPNHGNFLEQSENPNPQTDGCSALLDFNIHNFYQNANVLSNIDALQKPSGPISPTFLASGNVSSLFFDSSAKPVSDSAPQFPCSPLFLTSGHASSPIFDALPKHVSDSVPQFPYSPFLASGNGSSLVFDAPWKPETYSAPQFPATHSFTGFGNVSSPNCGANAPAPQQHNSDENKEPKSEENKEHKLNMNL